MDHLPLAAEPIEAVKQSTVRTLPPPIASEADDRVLLLEIVDYYRDTLKRSPEAQKYLRSHGLQSAEMFEHFRLGFANRTLGYRLPGEESLRRRGDVGQITIAIEFRTALASHHADDSSHDGWRGLRTETSGT